MSDERLRLEELKSYAVLDSAPEQALDDLTALAAQICGAPIAMISLIDEHRQWFKARTGIEMAETPRDISFCGHAVHQRDLFIVPDARHDERFLDNPLVTGQPGICFYAGAPLVTPAGAALGALCVIDHVPRTLAPGQQQSLRTLARQVMGHLELHRHTRKLAESEERLQFVTENARVGLVVVDRERRYTYANGAYAEILDLTSQAIVGRSVPEVLPGVYENQIRPQLDRAFAGERVSYELRKPTDAGDKYYAVKYEPTGVDEEVRFVVVVITEVTEHKQAETALKKTEGLLRVSVEHAVDAFLLHDAAGKFLDANPHACESLGYTREELLNLSVSDVSSLGGEEAKRIWDQLDAGSILTVNDHHRRKNGTRFPVEIRLGSFDLNGKKLVLRLARDTTERSRVEAVVRQYPAIIESSDDAIISKTLDGIITSWNPAAERMFGYAAADIIGKPITLLFPPDRLQEENEIIARIARGDRVRHFETIRIRKDGSQLNVSATISPIKDNEGNIIGASKIVRDITERRRAEQQLLWKTAFFEAQANSALDGILIVDNERKTVLQNQRLAELWNFPPGIASQIEDGPRLEWVTSQVKDPQKFAAKISWLYAHPQEISRDQIELVDGRIFDRDSAPVLGQDGKYYGRIWSFRNITDRIRSQEQIVEQAALLDKARDGILVRDLDGKILYWNHGAERMYGWTREKVLGQNVCDLFYADSKVFEEANGKAISEGEWSGEFRHQTLNRGEITVEARWTLIRDHEGRPKSVLAINTDITERKKIEAQFLRAQRMESIGTLAGGVAHDLNNILAPIMMAVEVLKATATDPQARDILGTLAISAERGASIVRQVLSFARGMEGERVEVQPAHLLNDIGNIIRDTFPKDIRLQFSIPAGIWTILGDATQMHQILLNLCVNARDAMPNGGSLTVGVENCVLDEHYAAMNIEAKPGRYVVIGVSDSGTGIPPAILDKIFEPFFTTKDLTKGTGLGLSTVMAIIKSHEGFVNVYSEPGKGTTFKVYLPAVGDSSGARSAEPQEDSLPRGNGETILIVDDEASVRSITAQTLEAFGYRVLTASDGAEAVALYAQHRNEIAVVLTDMMMPIMDGPATIHALMRINPTVKIIAASGLNSNGGSAMESGAGDKHFLTKPYTAGTLLKALRTVLDEA